jgi:hypothetical protein
LSLIWVFRSRSQDAHLEIRGSENKNGERIGTLSGTLLAPRMRRSTNRQADPDVWFRIIHLAKNGPHDAPVAHYREQMVEIALGPNGAFQNSNAGIPPRRKSRRDERPAAVVTPCLAPGGRGLLLAQGQDL